MEGIQMRDTDAYRGEHAGPTSQTPLKDKPDESAKHEKKVWAVSTSFILKLTLINC